MTIVSASTIGKFSMKQVLNFFQRNSTQAQYDANVQKMVQETTFELEAQVKAIASRLGNLEEDAEGFTTTPEAVALFHRLFPEAVFALTSDRRRLLVAALAGLFTPVFQSEVRSRVARAVIALEPSDVLLLRKFKSEPLRWMSTDPTVLEGSNRLSLQALEATGCVRVNRETLDSGQIFVTEVGDALLASLTCWEPTATPADSQASHPTRPTDSEEEPEEQDESE